MVTFCPRPAELPQDVDAAPNAAGDDSSGNAMPVDANKRALDACKRLERPDSHPSRKTSLHDLPNRFYNFAGISTIQKLHFSTNGK